MLDSIPCSPKRALRCLNACAFVVLVAITGGCGGNAETRLAEVRALHEVGDFSSSVEPLRQILAAEPDHEEANYLLGVTLVQTRQPSLAIWPLRKAAESEEYGFLAQLVLAATLLQTEGFEEAVAMSNRLLERDPDHVGALVVRIHANLGVGREEDALVDADRLIELDPAHFHAYQARATALAKLGRMEEAEASWKRVAEVGSQSGQAALAAQGCTSLVRFYRGIDSDKAESALVDCLEELPTDPMVLRTASSYYDEAERPEVATAAWTRAVEEAPDDYSLRVSLAERHDRGGEGDEAEAVLSEAAELFDDARAWSQLAIYRLRQGKLAEAQEANERALARAGGSSQRLLFRKADLLIQLGDIEAASEVADQLGEAVYRDILRGRVLAARGDDEGALEAYEAGLARWPNNASARFLAGGAAERLGLRAKALSHYREAVRADEKATDAALAAAVLQLADGNFEEAARLARTQALNRPFTGPEPYVVGARAAAALEEYEAARRTLAGLALVKGQELVALTELAAVERLARGPAVAANVIEKSGLDLSDPANSRALASLCEDLASLGREAEALVLVDRALSASTNLASTNSASPNSAELYDLRGRVLFHQGNLEGAQAALDKALELDAELATAHAALARLAVRKGELEEALVRADRALAIDPSDAATAHLAAQIVISLGRVDEGIDRLRKLLRTEPGSAAAANNLAWQLAERGEDLPMALELAKRAVRFEKRSEFLDTLGWVQLKRGDAAAAAASFEAALELNPGESSVRYRMALALAELGREGEALEMLRQALGGEPFPELELAKAEIARLEGGIGATR